MEALRQQTALLKTIIGQRIQQQPVSAWQPPENSDSSFYGDFIRRYSLSSDEQIILLLALLPHLFANFFESIILEHFPQGGDFPEMGGMKGTNHRGMLPTGETAQFVLAGHDVEARIRVARYFSSEHNFHRHGILSLETVKDGEPALSGRILLAQEHVDMLTTGKVLAPLFSQEFPARRLETNMTWEDLVLRPATEVFIQDIRTWIQFNHVLAQDTVISRKLKRGYRVLFYGPPGTGKTLTASLLGKQFSKEVYRIDLSQIVSKFIGETEKNLERIFARAENRDWIIFFDEADSLFGKRSSISSAHDKYANQEVSYLLQRVEDYPGLIILASNFKNNIDQAFVRRFNSIVHFPLPDAAERLLIWKKNAPQSIPLHTNVNLKTYADKYEFSGSAITNIMQYACLSALSRPEPPAIHDHDITNGIRRELLKEDRIQ